MSESIAIAFEIYFLGFIIALGMAGLIKLIVLALKHSDRIAKKSKSGAPEAAAESRGEGAAADADGHINGKEGTA